MAVPVARVHLKVAHAALPALLPTPPKSKMLPLLPTAPCAAAILPKPAPAKPSRADADQRWDARKTKPANAKPSANSVGHGSSPRKNATSPPRKPGRADSVERWDAHKKSASPASSSSSSATPSLVSSSRCSISRASSAERWDVHKKRCPPQVDLLDDGESCTGSNDDIDMEEEILWKPHDDIDMEEEILWKPRAMYAGPGFIVAAPQPTMLPIPTAFLVGVA